MRSSRFGKEMSWEKVAMAMRNAAQEWVQETSFFFLLASKAGDVSPNFTHA
jgi:hypothetical protein